MPYVFLGLFHFCRLNEKKQDGSGSHILKLDSHEMEGAQTFESLL